MAKKLTPLRAIRQKCLDCSNGQFIEVRECPIKTCALYGYRMGHRPKDEEIPTDEVEDEKSLDSPPLFDKEGQRKEEDNAEIET